MARAGGRGVWGYDVWNNYQIIKIFLLAANMVFLITVSESMMGEF